MRPAMSTVVPENGKLVSGGWSVTLVLRVLVLRQLIENSYATGDVGGGAGREDFIGGLVGRVSVLRQRSRTVMRPARSTVVTEVLTG